jgi:formylglycine-generating enzyme required for sulfatase activity
MKFFLKISRRLNGSIMALIAASLLIFGNAAIAAPDGPTVQTSQTFRDCSDCPEMVTVPAGSFAMGSSAEETAKYLASLPVLLAWLARILLFPATEHPEHLVTIPQSFALARYVVTHAEFASFIRETGYSTNNSNCVVWQSRHYRNESVGWEHPAFSQSDREPVVCVSWDDAQAYVRWLNGKVRGGAGGLSAGSDGPYRLPSEAEWEYAARVGKRTAFWWGDDIGSGNADCQGCNTTYRRPAPVGSFRPNPLGLYDMNGNVSEWTADCWNGTYAQAPGDSSAWTKGDCSLRAVRGGDWTGDAETLRSAHRADFGARDRANYIGFRVARTLH